MDSPSRPRLASFDPRLADFDMISPPPSKAPSVDNSPEKGLLHSPASARHSPARAPPPPPPIYDDDDAPARLIVKNFELSAAQTKYQAERHVEARPVSFYKDAAPRVDHYMRSQVSVADVDYGMQVPVKLELAYADGTPVSKEDSLHLKILGDSLGGLEVPPNVQVSFCYRIEIGSFRRADRKFSVKVSPAAQHVQGIQSVCTPGVLVLSKKRLAAPSAETTKRRATEVTMDVSEKRQLFEATSAILGKVSALEDQVRNLTAVLAGATGVLVAAPLPPAPLAPQTVTPANAPAPRGPPQGFAPPAAPILRAPPAAVFDAAAAHAATYRPQAGGAAGARLTPYAQYDHAPAPAPAYAAGPAIPPPPPPLPTNVEAPAPTPSEVAAAPPAIPPTVSPAPPFIPEPPF